MRKSLLKTLAVIFGLVLILTIIGGVVSGCQQGEKKETKSEQKEEAEKETKIAFENPDLLVSVEWLSKHQSDKDIQIIDVRPEGEYNGGHIAGAVNLPIEKTVDTGNPIPAMVAPKDKIESSLGDLGISNDKRVIVYDAGGTPFAGRIFWILKYYGQGKVSLLDGGIKRWQAEGKKLKWDLPQIKKTTYTAVVDPKANATKKQVLGWIQEKSENVVFVDTRPESEWNTGHLPGAVRLDWIELFTNNDPTTIFKSAEELQKLFDDNGITKDKEVVLY